MKPSDAGPMAKRRRVRGLWPLGATAVALVLSLPSLAAAATVHVTDAADGSPPAATLRNQIAAAAPGDTVVIDGGVNPNLSSGEIAIDKNLTIRGQGASQTTISAGQTSRVFNIGSVTPEVTVAIERLAITGAYSGTGANGDAFVNGSPGGHGGAIINSATLTIASSTFSGNSSGFGGSGGFGASGGRGGDGGAISSSGPLTITNSTLASNKTGAGGNGGNGTGVGACGGDGGRGGAISSSGPLTITNSTLAGNSTRSGGNGGNGTDIGGGGGNGGCGGGGGRGGAISSSGATAITNSTLAGNSTGSGGNGGIGFGGAAGAGGTGGHGGATFNGGVLTITNSTLSGNATGAGGLAPGGEPSGASGSGGGVFSSPGTATIANSILSNGASNCAGSITDGGHNIAFPALAGCPATFGSGDPKLDSADLADNGGPTRTIALLSGSAAIDQVPSGCPAADQRGFSRSAATCDIGAFEVQPANDDDGDGALDFSDNCGLVPNPAQTNTDGDAQGDACDPDDDNDAVADGSDNCGLVSNPAQTNTDGDAQGDACDPDNDNDGVADASDDCSPGETGWTSSTATDHDADGCRDAGEDSDDDNDSIADGADQCPTGVTGTGSDPDEDGCKNAEDVDDDGDDVPDASDGCPTTPGPASNAGCPPDTSAPETTIVEAKINQERRKATFRFSSSEPGSSFRCKLDSQVYKPCSSPKTYKGLEPGGHGFRVSATDESGNADPTPDIKRFRIRR